MNKGLFEFIKKSPSAFHAVKSIEDMLMQNGYKRLYEEEAWDIKEGTGYFVIRNDSSIIAFNTGNIQDGYSFNIAASHSDSPSFKIKELSLNVVKGHYTRLNTEGYGGMICSSWFDRPLSIAGRIVLKTEDGFETKLLNVDRDLLLIPNMPIHFNREVNDGYKYNKQVDLLPLFAADVLAEEDFDAFIAKELGVDKDMIYGRDLFLYVRQ